ncbi:MAG: signal peptidase I [Candidatus Zipacnadales bacterium]
MRVIRKHRVSDYKCADCACALMRIGEANSRTAIAGPLLRLAGYCADQAVLGLLMLPAFYIAAVLEAEARAGPSIFLSALMWVSLLSTVYFIVPTALWGQTFGKWFAGIVVVGPDGKVPGWKRATVRGAVAALGELLFNICLVGILDPLWLLWNRYRQTLHDMAAGTIVITSRRRPIAVTFVSSLIVGAATQVGLVFLVLRPFILQAYYVPSASMHPTLLEHDRLLVNKLNNRLELLRRGDIIVFRAPPGAYYSNPIENPNLNERKDFIKRLVALPGDTIKSEDGRLWLRKPGEKALHTVEEPYLQEPQMEHEWGPFKVPEGHVLVLGDNRNNSNDSSRWIDAAGNPAPFVPLANVEGRAFFRYWPPFRWGELPRGGL